MTEQTHTTDLAGHPSRASWMALHQGISRSFAVVAFVTTLLASQSLRGQDAAPLDPLIGDTGQPLSAVALAADVQRYELDLEIFPADRRIAGTGKTEFRLVAAASQLELKLDSRFHIDRIELDGVAAQFHREGGILTIDLPEERPAGSLAVVAVHYDGEPHVAKRAPWEGGTVWSETPDCQPWIATAVQGEGCDLFWPCRDHFADKADSMRIRLTVPAGLAAVTNGVLQQINPLPGDRLQFDWLLSVPASDYNIALNIGPYERIRDSYESINGLDIPIEFWALPPNIEKARALLAGDIKGQLEFFERRLGPYPWGSEKLGFVETPHLGMEHQTVNAYGKGYTRDEAGFDWLVQHELAHEWFGNLVTHEQLNDAWIHEGFGAYMQPAYAREKLGIAAYRYQMYKTYLGLRNCDPVVRSGVITSDEAFSSDIYGKGSWTLHTLRWLIGEESFWQATRELLYAADDTAGLRWPLFPRYRDTDDFASIVNRVTGGEYRWLFDVYLRQAALPSLEMEREADRLTLRWIVPDDLPFPMPIPVSINGDLRAVDMSSGSAVVLVKNDDTVLIDPEMNVLRQLPLIGDCEENQAKRRRRGN